MFSIWTVYVLIVLVAGYIGMTHFDEPTEYYIDDETGEVYTRSELSKKYIKETCNDVVKFYNTHINTMEKS